MSQRGEVVIAEVDSVEQNSSLGRLVQTRHQLCDSGFSRAVLPNECDALARPQRNIQLAHRPSVAAGIAKADILENEAVPHRVRNRQRVRTRRDSRAHIEEDEKIPEIKRLLVDTARREQNTLDHVATARERRGEKHERARSDLAAHGAYENDHVRRVVTDRTEY